MGRLRAAYGETGREPQPYSTISALSTTSLFGSGFGDIIGSKQSGQGGLVTGPNLGNTDLKPERNKESEVGTDFGFFNQRSDLSVTYYSKRSTDVILPVPVNAAATGASTALVNGATITNKGLELALNVHPYTVARRRHHARRELRAEHREGRVALPGRAVHSVSHGRVHRVGRIVVGRLSRPASFAARTSFAADWARRSRSPASAISPTSTRRAARARRRARCTSPASTTMPVVNPDDRVIADPNPHWTAGLNGQIRIGHVQLSTLFDIRRGGQVWDGTRAALDRFGTAAETDVRKTDGVFGKNVLTNESVAGSWRRQGRLPHALRLADVVHHDRRQPRATCSRNSSRTAAS